MVVGGGGGTGGRKRLEEQGASGEGLVSAIDYAKREYNLE